MGKKKKTQRVLKNEIDLKGLRVFSLDVSQDRTGWALFQGLEPLAHGFIKGSKGSNDAASLMHYQIDVKEVIEEMARLFGDIHFFVMEDMNMKSRFNSGKVLMQYQAVAKVACATYDSEIGVNLANNMSVKSFFKIISRKKSIPESIIKKVKEIKNPKITAVKVQMVNAVNRCFPELKLTYEQNDEADAIAMAFYLIKEIMENVDD